MGGGGGGGIGGGGMGGGGGFSGFGTLGTWEQVFRWWEWQLNVSSSRRNSQTCKS